MARSYHFWIFAALLCWLPLPLGSNRPWAWLVMELAVGVLLLSGAVLGQAGSGQGAAVAIARLRPSLPPFLAALGWALAQCLPVPSEGLAHPLWAQAAAVLGPLPGHIALAPQAALSGAARLLAYGGIVFLGVQYGRSVKRAETLVTVLAAAAVAYASYGLAVKLSGAETILGMPKWAYRGAVTSSFVNRNSYATYAGLGLLCLTALAQLRLAGRGWSGAARRLLVEGDKRAWLAVAGLPLTLAALLLTGSRAGAVASLAGLISLLICLKRLRLSWELGAFALVGLSSMDILTALGNSDSGEAGDRLRMYGLALQAIKDHPWAGSGLGGFPAVFAQLRPPGMVGVWDNVHNTYLQLGLELGLPAAGALLFSVGWLVWRSLKGVMERQHNQLYPALGFAASVLVGSHALVDFSLEIPAVAATYLALLGMAAAQSWRSSEPTAEG